MTDVDNPTVDPMTEVAGALRELVTSNQAHNTAVLEEIRALRPTAPDPAPDSDLLPGGRTADPADTMYDRFDQYGYTRADFELAGLFFDGANAIGRNVARPADFQRAYLRHVFENPAKDPSKFGAPIRVAVEGADGADRIRAMDAQESGYGLQLIGASYELQMWEAARNSDPLMGLIRTIPMSAPVAYIPVNGALPEMLLLAESTTYNATRYTTSKTPSNRATLTAKKFGINQIWSGELEQDSIIAFTPFLRDMLNQSAALHLASSMYNGDTTNAGTGNLNLDDADPADTKHYLAYDGIKKYWLLTAPTTQAKDQAGALDPKEIDRARGKLNGMNDDVNAALDNIHWGADATKLLLVCDFDSYMNMLDLDTVTTVDKYGIGATILTGELGRYKGIKVFAPSYASKTEADGKASTTEANNTKGCITVFNPNGFVAGQRAGLSLYLSRLQGTDQYLFELYTRRAFTRFGGQVAAGIFDITV